MVFANTISVPLTPPATAGSASSSAARRGLVGASAALGFCLPLSVSGVAVSLAVLIGLVACQARAAWRLRLWREPIAVVSLALFAWVVLRTLVASGFTPATYYAID